MIKMSHIKKSLMGKSNRLLVEVPSGFEPL